uniref:ABC transporter domain-containing protein n=1 Tax=Sphenodon punctatus TaxID=8508 RepID=A0A8D0L8Z4_SPHPU
MQRKPGRHRSVCQQTGALLFKNVLVKWRMKMQNLQEWFLSLIFLLALFILATFLNIGAPQDIPFGYLGRLDDPAYNATGATVAYSPVTNTTRQIMEKVASNSIMRGTSVKFLDCLVLKMQLCDQTGSIERKPYICYNYSAHYCHNQVYWYRGFLSLQTSIDAAIIEMVTNHSVWDEMKSISGVRMRSSFIVISGFMENIYIIVIIAMCFSPMMYSLSQNVTSEKRKLKELMEMMGLLDSAFWLSWGLLYAVYIFITACLLTAVTWNEFFILSSFSAILLLFFLYGIASMHFCFMLSSLLKKPKTTCYTNFLLTFLFGSLSCTTVVVRLPAPLEWTFCLFCPFTFATGISKVCKYSASSNAPCFLFLSDKYGVTYPPLYFLKPSYWFKSRRRHAGERFEIEKDHEQIFSDNAEPVPPEFDGKEAIRINNIKKTYKHKDKKTEALRGLFLNIYEDQITALLGHSGAGKTTLLNILSGLSKPSDGSVTILKYKLSEMEAIEEIREITGLCPQFNVQFDILTVKENLRIFAKVKGIQSNKVEEEVKKLLTMLDISSIQDTQADKLSGGQKRKLSLAIAMLGDPQVLLLDEPTSGMDPCSRQHVWNLLKEHKAGRAIVVSTQFMDEADILADRKAFISHGRLKCVGSSLFLKNKWGIGYHLRMQVNESCDSERMLSLVKQYIPNATLSGRSDSELSYTLPSENVDKFPDLFHSLDSQPDQEIMNYGVSMTTMEDVFLKLEDAESINEEGKILDPEGRGDTFSPNEMEEELLSLSDTGKATVSGIPLWRQQVCAMARMRFLRLKHEGKTLRSIFIIHFFKNYIGIFLFLPGTGIENFIHGLESQNIMLEIATGKNITDQLQHNGAIKVSLEEQTEWRLGLYICLLEPSKNVSSANKKDHCNNSSFNFLSQIKAHSHLRVSGLFPSAYWCGQALVDSPLQWIVFFSTIGLYHLVGVINAVPLGVTYLLGYGACLLFVIYLISFLVRKGRNKSDFWSFIFIVVSVWLYIMCNIIYIFLKHCVFFIFLLRCLEMKYGRSVMRKDPVFRIFPKKKIIHQNAEEPGEDDQDVQEERARVRHAVASPNQKEKPVIIISNLRKEYKTKGGSLCKKKTKRKKVATKNVSFCVKKGEVLGLLGPNGAGKSTTINMITGDTTLTAGQVSERENTIGFLGYCPQENPLWPNLTVKEHLEIYAAVKGLRKEDATIIINRIAKALELQKHLKKATKRLSAGITRKLCFALSVLGNPKIMLFDEPTTGMDPKGQRRVWKAIRATLKNKEQGAILTTHYMEEAEAVCDRVAIMVSGQLRCINTIQYLKSKFGKGYLLQIKVKKPDQVDHLHAEILQIFPHAARQERFSTLLVYNIPMGDALPLTQAFTKLETAKQSFDIEEYSFSLNTLEQVFLELCREQERENFDLTLDATFEWRQLQQEDL